MKKLESEPKWQGERAGGSGRPRKTSKKQDKQMVNCVLRNRGREKITVMKVKRNFPALRDVSDTLVEDRLKEAELKYLRRRNKSKVGKLYLQDRIDYCHAVMRKHQSTLDLWAYTDGTVYYLDRTEDEHEQSQVAALGAMVWRQSDRKDALYQDCLAPSSYNKAQGMPIRIWGMLACGVLHVHVLDKREIMNTELYCELIEDFFEDWMGNCTYLVCDFERCLRSAAAVAELERAGLQLVDGYPRCSQDFNAIENAWGFDGRDSLCAGGFSPASKSHGDLGRRRGPRSFCRAQVGHIVSATRLTKGTAEGDASTTHGDARRVHFPLASCGCLG